MTTPSLITYESGEIALLYGFDNLGNTCWFNALIQLLLGLPTLNKIILSLQHREKYNILAKTYISFVHQTVEGYFTHMGIKPLYTEFMCIIDHKLTNKFNTNIQNDIIEGLLLFIEALNIDEVTSLFNTRYISQSTCNKCNLISRVSKDPEILTMYYHEYNLNTAEKFNNWIRVHPSNIDNHNCYNCNSNLYDIEYIHQLREVILVGLSRFEYNKQTSQSKERKNTVPCHDQISFPANNGNTTLIYKLVGVCVNSSSNLEYGHYTTFSRRGNEWLHFNDAHTIKSMSPDSYYPNAYLYAYHLVEIQQK